MNDKDTISNVFLQELDSSGLKTCFFFVSTFDLHLFDMNTSQTFNIKLLFFRICPYLSWQSDPYGPFQTIKSRRELFADRREERCL